MRLTRSIGIVGLCIMQMCGCATTGDYGPETYVVGPQDTLYSIAWRHNLDFRDLAKWNRLAADYHIWVGQVLLLQAGGAEAPGASPPARVAPPGASPAARSEAAPRVGKPQALPEMPLPQGTTSASNRNLAPPPHGPASSGARNGASKWVWPTDRIATPRPVPGGGILLLGHLGQEVRAANAGRVVYIGSGLRGYGNLIIIKHGDSVLSAYAHNRELLVREGQDVATGQGIARMGQGPHQIAALYFEIRLNGKPVDPMRYLLR